MTCLLSFRVDGGVQGRAQEGLWKSWAGREFLARRQEREQGAGLDLSMMTRGARCGLGRPVVLRFLPLLNFQN